MTSSATSDEPSIFGRMGVISILRPSNRRTGRIGLHLLTRYHISLWEP